MNAGRAILEHLVRDIPSGSVNGTIVNGVVYSPTYQERAAYGADNLKSFMSINNAFGKINGSDFLLQNTDIGANLEKKFENFIGKYLCEQANLNKMIGRNIGSFVDSNIKNSRAEFRSGLLHLIKETENIIKIIDPHYSLEENRIDINCEHISKRNPNSEQSAVCAIKAVGRDMRSAQVNFNKGNILNNGATI